MEERMRARMAQDKKDMETRRLEDKKEMETRMAKEKSETNMKFVVTFIVTSIVPVLMLLKTTGIIS